MGLDVGDKRIGISLSDPLRITAQGIETFNRLADEAADIEYISALAKKNDVEFFVCGLPKNMNGTIGPQAEKVMAFAEALSAKSGIEVRFYDERLTTVMVERTLIEADMSRAKRRKVVDKLASVAILQGYLDNTGLKGF
ncbi:MAG: Holliday junction resolvase RuvX [Christensenellaceae bacterium]|nr:Holliday junction resolvase RuvX [Christensenellaceae bacterium]